MALKAKSLFLYGLEVTKNNRYIDFRVVPAEPLRTAVLPLGYYSLTSLTQAVVSALKGAAPAETFTCTANRTFSGGLENRVSIATSTAAIFEIYFGTGVNAAVSARGLLGFASSDLTGALSYQGTSTAGIALSPSWWGKNFKPPEFYRKNFGTVNVSASGQKESIVFAIQRFIGVEFEHEPNSSAFTSWPALINWLIQQRPFDFTPEIDQPTVVYQVTLESSAEDGKGLALQLKEMLPSKPFQWTTGPLVFRLIE